MTINARELFTGMTDETLIQTATAALEVASERGITLPYAAGVLTVEQAVELQAPTETAPEAVELMKESLLEQLSTAHVGYEATVYSLNFAKRKNKLKTADSEAVGKEFQAWFSVDQVKAAKVLLEINPDAKFTLVATPNVHATKKEIIKAANVFGKTMPYDTNVCEGDFDNCSFEQLSGTNPDNGNDVQFSLIPDTVSHDEFCGTVVYQRAKLAELKKANPELKAPSVLEVVTFWQTLKAAGAFSNSYDYRSSCISHFDLPEQRIGGRSHVPISHVYNGGPSLRNSRGYDESHYRISVG